MKAILIALILVSPALAQVRSTFNGRSAQQVFGSGTNSVDRLKYEKELLDRAKKNSLTWDDFPLRSYPQPTGNPPRSSAAAERAFKRLTDKREEYTKRYLRGRLFAGEATITAVTSSNGKYNVTAQQRLDDKTEAERDKMKELDQYRAESTYAVTGKGSPMADDWDARHRASWVSEERLSVGDKVVLHGEIDVIDLDSKQPRIVEISLKNVKTQAD